MDSVCRKWEEACESVVTERKYFYERYFVEKFNYEKLAIGFPVVLEELFGDRKNDKT